jgi:hypothetical protein
MYSLTEVRNAAYRKFDVHGLYRKLIFFACMYDLLLTPVANKPLFLLFVLLYTKYCFYTFVKNIR